MVNSVIGHKFDYGCKDWEYEIISVFPNKAKIKYLPTNNIKSTKHSFQNWILEKQLKENRFDRKNPFSQVYLRKLRRLGNRRLGNYFQFIKAGKPDLFFHRMYSQALLNLIYYCRNEFKNTVLVDCGCGESADALIMAGECKKTYGFDCFPLEKRFICAWNNHNDAYAIDFYKECRKAKFILQDVCEDWKINEKVDYIIANAITDLMSISDLYLFAEQVSKNLKINGFISIDHTLLFSGGYQLFSRREEPIELYNIFCGYGDYKLTWYSSSQGQLIMQKI